MTQHVVTCRGPRRNAPDGTLCGGFVSARAGPFRVVALLSHSSKKGQGTDVAGCLRCGQLHEIEDGESNATPTCEQRVVGTTSGALDGDDHKGA